MKRKLLYFGLVCVGSGLVAFWFFLKNDLINQASYDHIRLGMTIDEVVAVLGTSGGDVSAPMADGGNISRETLQMQFDGDWGPRPDDNEPNRRLGWAGQNGMILIRVDTDQRVTDKMFFMLKPLTFFERIRRLARL